jgi:hypothetical protein
MKKIWLIAAALACAAPAAADFRPQLSDEVCGMLVTHTPAADVEYKPGVDVTGKPVVEADLNLSPVAVPDTIQFDITVDVARHAGINVPIGFENLARIGTVAVDKSGKMTFNGQPMEGPQEAALKALCHQKRRVPKSKDIIYNP